MFALPPITDRGRCTPIGIWLSGYEYTAEHYSCAFFDRLNPSVTMIRRSWMTGISIETTLELWASSLRAVKARMAPLFTQERVAASAGLFLDGLLGDERRKTGWMRAEAAGDPGPWRQQAILGRGWWDADALRDIVREYALETLADQDAVLVLDETGFLKQGNASCGVARQYTGSAGKITNCQIGVFCAYVSRHGPAFIDRALDLPKALTVEPSRMTPPHVPNGIAFATKPALAVKMISQACSRPSASMPTTRPCQCWPRARRARVRLWTYVRDDRPFCRSRPAGGADLPCASDASIVSTDISRSEPCGSIRLFGAVRNLR